MPPIPTSRPTSAPNWPRSVAAPATSGTAATSRYEYAILGGMTSTVDEAGVTATYRAARNSLLALRGDHARALEEFAFPDLGNRWNWGIDWFDAVARGNDRACLTIVEQDESSQSYSYDEMAHRSDQVAAHLAQLGVRRGDSVVLMLGNQVELWESMLAVIKLGAVVMPTTTAVVPGQPAGRVERGAARRPARPPRATRPTGWSGPPPEPSSPTPPRCTSSTTSRATTSASPSVTPTPPGAPRTAGRATQPHTECRSPPPSTRGPGPTTGCCSTSRPARRAG